jgi:hypothetical protein
MIRPRTGRPTTTCWAKAERAFVAPSQSRDSGRRSPWPSEGKADRMLPRVRLLELRAVEQQDEADEAREG